MNKIKYYYLIGSIIIILAIFGGIVFLAKSAKAEEETSTAFPVDEAGIAAYVKVDNINDINLEAIANACDSVEKLGQSYLIGTIKVENAVGFNYPHIYVGADGWIVTYYLKTEEASRIIQWKDYTPGTIKTTTLKEAIDIIAEKTGITYSAPIKYYDFEFPEANKITLVADSNDFHVTVPGTLYEASYGVILKKPCCSGSECRHLWLRLDDNLAWQSFLGCWWTCGSPFASYGYYDLSEFNTGITHHIVFYNDCGDQSPAFAATALIYKN